MNEEEQIELLNEIHDELYDSENVVISYLNCEKWMNGTDKYSHKEVIEKLLPLCKLLNQLFFDHGPGFEDLEKVD